MTEQEWQATALVLDRGFKWREPFAAAHERVYRSMLDGYPAVVVAEALRRLVAGGQVFGPAPGEIVRAIEGDADRPTFIEAFSAIYDSRPAFCGGRGVLWTRSADGKSERECRLDRAWEIHPLLGSFVDSYGLERLALLEVEHEEHGGIVRRDLEGTWESFVAANEGRDAAALAAGRRRELARSTTRRLDPAAVLGLSVDTMRGED